MRALWRKVIGFLFSIGAYPGETETQRSKRRIFVGASMIATLLMDTWILEGRAHS